jgi:signal transduction histidine kinase
VRIGTAPSFRFRLVAAVAALTALGLAAAGALAYLVELRRVDARLADSLGRAVAELRVYAANHPASSLERLVSGAVAQSVNAEYECTLGRTAAAEPATRSAGGTWTHAGADSACRRALADTKLTDALAQTLTAVPGAPNTAPPATARHLNTADGGWAFVATPVSSASEPDRAGVYAVVLDRAQQRAEVGRSYLTGYLPLAAAAVLMTTAAGWAAAGFILRPLRVLARTTREIASGPGGAPDIGRRVALEGPAEATAVAAAMNTLLDSLQRAWDSGRQFLDDAGHELRTPLTVVGGHLELMDPSDPADAAAARDLALDEVDRMRRLTDSLTTLAQADRAGFARRRPLALGPWFDEVADKARALGDRDWRVGARTEAWAQADPHRLTEAVLELAANAVKHTPAGSKIEFALAQSGGWVRISVRDWGDGVGQGDLARIFGRFERGGGARRADGAGLGLAIVAKIAAAHGGRVAVESAPGRGAEFALVLPAGRGEEPT